jgi:heme-degrading monooxygenase HmoA
LPIVETVALHVLPGQHEKFENLNRELTRILATKPGFISATVHRGVKETDRYLIYTVWESMEALEAANPVREFRQLEQRVSLFFKYPTRHFYRVQETFAVDQRVGARA